MTSSIFFDPLKNQNSNQFPISHPNRITKTRSDRICNIPSFGQVIYEMIMRKSRFILVRLMLKP